MLNQDVYSKAMINILGERLKFNNLKHKVILYSANLGYEYNYLTKRIRPINSVFWFNVSKSNADIFMNFIDAQIEKAIDQFEDSGYVTNFLFGNCDNNGNITIDMDSITEANIMISDNDRNDSLLIWSNYYNFCVFLSKIFNESNDHFKEILKKIDDFSDIE